MAQVASLPLSIFLQATDLEIQRKEMRNTKKQTVCSIKFHITKHDVYLLQ